MVGSVSKGVLLALGAYVFWGLHPIYWKLLQNVPAVEIVSHRVVWSLIFFILIISLKKDGKQLTEKIKECNGKFVMLVPALLIGTNWAMFVWAVNAGFMIETSLGYFICPLLSIFLGVVFLNEHLRRLQWLAVLIASAGILAMTLVYGQFPWISLYVAGTWGAYGLLRKRSPFNAIEGLTLDTAVLSIPAIVHLAYLSITGNGSFFSDTSTGLLLIGGGITSGLPLLAFVAGARTVSLSLIGILQYVYPTLVFLVGVLLYDEILSEVKMIGLTFIWIALVIFTIEGMFLSRRSRIAVGMK